jgi:hypothetical protein
LLSLQYEEIEDEPLPRRWVDLIHHLNERERAQTVKLRRKTAPDTKH